MHVVTNAGDCGQKRTKAIFATPHVIERANKPSWEEIKEKTQQLRQLCAEAQIDIMLYPGAEVQMNWELLPELGATGAYCLNGGRYLLIELPAAESLPMPMNSGMSWS